MNGATEPLPWRRLLLFALVGTVIAVTITLVDLQASRAATGGLIHTGPDGPAAELLARDFPDEVQSSFGEHDGPMFYAVARDALDLDAAAESLDRPRYRLQHPLLSWMAWVAHPVGGGDALLWTMFGVGVAAIFLGCLAMGALSSTLRGPAYLGVLFGILPGTFMSLRITTADALAVVLMLAALVLSLRNRTVLAAVAAIATVLAKEPMFLGLLGLAIWRRDRRGLALVLPAVVVAGAWFLWLRRTVNATGDVIMEFGMPFVGLFSSVRLWVQGIDVMAMASVVPATVLATFALVRSRLRHPLALALGLQFGFMLLLTRDVIGLQRNGTRMSLPVLALGIIVVATPRALEAVQAPASRATTGAMASSASTPRPTQLMP